MTRKPALVLALSILATPVLHAQDMHKEHAKAPAKAADSKAAAKHSATGVVRKVDLARGTVTLAHDPVKSLGWPAMTMDFTVKDKAVAEKLKADRKVEFEFVQQGKDYVITSVK